MYKLKINTIYNYNKKYQKIYIKLIQPLSHIHINYIKHLIHLPTTLFTKTF